MGWDQAARHWQQLLKTCSSRLWVRPATDCLDSAAPRAATHAALGTAACRRDGLRCTKAQPHFNSCVVRSLTAILIASLQVGLTVHRKGMPASLSSDLRPRIAASYSRHAEAQQASPLAVCSTGGLVVVRRMRGPCVPDPQT